VRRSRPHASDPRARRQPGTLLPGNLWIYCLIGHPPASAEEGVRLSVPGIINFNEVVSGENVYIKTS
jgi:hypothetical protein